MGNRHSRSTLRNAIIYLNISADPIGLDDEDFWSQIWLEEISVAGEVLKGISTQEIRMLRDGSPKNFAILVYKMVERLYLATGTLCNTQSQQTSVINATKILIRTIPCIFEDRAWRGFFTKNRFCVESGTARHQPELDFPKKGDHEKNYKAYLPTGATEISIYDDTDNETDDNNETNVATLIETKTNDNEPSLVNDLRIGKLHTISESLSGSEMCDVDGSLMETLIMAICDLLFCPEFTVSPLTDKYLNSTIDAPPEDLKSLPTCDYVWEPGVGFESGANSTTYFDKSRSELLRLLLVCISETLYKTPNASIKHRNQWLEIFASNNNRHALPLFTSLLNVVFNYTPSKSLPFNNLLSFQDTREELVELSIQILIVTMDYQFGQDSWAKLTTTERKKKNEIKSNLFIEYLSRIHKNDDFNFIIRGFVRLLNNRLESQGYLLSSSKQVNFEHELLILFWKVCNLNKKFVNYLLRRNEILAIVVPILYHLNENFQDASKTGIIHLGVFNLLILSGEREFGVKLNKPYQNSSLSKLPSFAGSHADLIIIVFHKLILYGHNLHQLFDFLLTILVNISPYLKGLTMMASKCLIQLFEIFSSSFVIFTEPNHHQLVVFLLEIFNNLIQYQFDSNANLVFSIIIKKDVFQALANLPTSDSGIQKILSKLIRKKQRHKELMHKILEEQNCPQHISSSTNVSPSVDSNKQQCNLSISSSPSSSAHKNTNQFGATVSSNSTNNNQGSGCSTGHAQESQLGGLRQGVSLVATPDICRVTQAIHPFDTDNEPTSQIFFGSSNQSVDAHAISFDDILNQASEHGSPVPDSTFAKSSQVSGESLIETDKRSEVASVLESDRIIVKSTKSKSEASTKRWKPTSDWVKHWKQSLPLHTSLRMIEVLAPQLDRLKQDQQKQQVEEIEMIKYLQDGTLVGLLPVPHPILIRKYHTNDETTLWFRTCTWGIIYVRNSIWADTNIRLIRIV